jgi:hypothetical protein
MVRKVLKLLAMIGKSRVLGEKHLAGLFPGEKCPKEFFKVFIAFERQQQNK